MRLIDADALKALIDEGWSEGAFKTAFFEEIDGALTIDPVKHGRWIPGREIAREMIGDVITDIIYEDWKCSDCGCTVEDEKPSWKYCPNCGAKMDGGEE